MREGAHMRVVVEGLAHRFPGTDLLFEHLDFVAEPGSTIAVCGPSGCGKSTLLSILAGWEKPYAGTVTREGVNRVGWVFQNPYGVAERTALDHVVFPLLAKGMRRKEAELKALEAMGLFDLEYAADRRFSDLSGGEAQRLMLARAVCSKPDMLLVDEPTAQLDTRTAHSVSHVLNNLSGQGMMCSWPHTIPTPATPATVCSTSPTTRQAAANRRNRNWKNRRIERHRFMGKKQRGTKVMNNGARRGRLAWAWSLLAVATAICVSVGACALLLPDRAPALLGSAGETTTAPASVQEYSGSQQVTVVPTISTERNLLGNANGTVTADWSADGLASGKGAYKVNDRVVVALNTATPLYRDLKTGDKGDDVLALNNELSRLGYNSVAGSDTYWWATSDGWRQLMNDNGNPSDGTLALADTMWIPENAVAVDEWTATTGSMVTGGTAIGKIPGALTKLTVKNGAAVGQDRTIGMYGVNGILPADNTEITDAEFLRNVSASETFQSMDMQTKKAGLDATVALKEPLQVLRVPVGAVFGIDGSSGCIVPKSRNTSNTPAKVTIVGSELGVSLVQVQDADASAIANVEIGSGLNGLVCK